MNADTPPVCFPVIKGIKPGRYVLSTDVYFDGEKFEYDGAALQTHREIEGKPLGFFQHELTTPWLIVAILTPIMIWILVSKVSGGIK